MKKPILLFTLLLISIISKAQKTDTIKGLQADTLLFVTVEHEPGFVGGAKKFDKYLAKNRQPGNYKPGKVIVTFIVEKDGSLNRAKVLRGISDLDDAETLRLIKNSPNWTPGTQNGHIVRVWYTVAVPFD